MGLDGHTSSANTMPCSIATHQIDLIYTTPQARRIDDFGSQIGGYLESPSKSASD